MPRRPAVILAVSLAANLLLAAALVSRPSLAPPVVLDFLRAITGRPLGSFAPASPSAASSSTSGASASALASSAPVHPRSPPPPPSLWDRLNAGVTAAPDLRPWVARLQAAGFPPHVIRALVSREVEQRYGPRLLALDEPDPATPFWKKPSWAEFSRDPARLPELQRLRQEQRALAGTALAVLPRAEDDLAAALRQRSYGSIPPAKVDRVQAIESDYNEMQQAVWRAQQGVTLPSDREQFALLDREKRADLAAVLTPDELAAYDLRNSPVSHALRAQLEFFDPSEAEYEAMYRAAAPFADLYQAYGYQSNFDPAARAQRQAETDALNAQLRAALGDQRYAQFQRASDSEYKGLSRLAGRDGVSAETTTRTFDLRDQTLQQATAIVADSSLDNAQKSAALQALGQTARSQIMGLLGPTTGAAYAQLANFWLDGLAAGSAVTVQNGRISVGRLPAPPAASAAPSPAPPGK